MTKYKTQIFLFFLILLSRIPFLFQGFGAEEDSWGLVLSAHNTLATGTYEVSRFPGHPLQELFYILFFSSHPLLFNLFSALFSAVAAVAFYQILKTSQLKYPLLLTSTFAFTPVVFVSSTYTIDYMWTVALILLSFLFLLKNNYWTSGLFLGLAIACRVTAGAMLIPVFIYAFQKDKSFYFNFLKLLFTACITGALFYLPIYLQYGQQFFDYYDQFPYPSFAKVFYKATFGVWGFLGFIGLAIGLALLAKKILASPSTIDRLTMACIAILILYTISYLRLPQKSGYMITIIPFLLILFTNYLRPKYLVPICILITSSSFIFGINITDKLRGAEYSRFAITKTISGQEIYLDPLSGTLYADYSKRKNKKVFTESVIEKCLNAPEKNAIICGWWYNELVVRNHFSVECNNSLFLGYANKNTMDSLINRGFSMYYLPEQNLYNDLLFKINSTDSIANPFY